MPNLSRQEGNVPAKDVDCVRCNLRCVCTGAFWREITKPFFADMGSNCKLNSHKSAMNVEAELSQLAEEFGFGVKHIGTSRWTKSHGAPGERAYVAVTTLEGTPLCIELSTRGWKVRKKRGR
jgi:hypothetical protein